MPKYLARSIDALLMFSPTKPDAGAILLVGENTNKG